MSAPAVEAAPQRLRILVGKKTGRGPMVVEYPMSENHKLAHAAASYVRSSTAR